MNTGIATFRKRWPALAAIAVLVAIALTAGTLFAANEWQQPELPAQSEQSVADATDPGLAADLPVTAAESEPPQSEPGSGVAQVVLETGRSDALEQWLADRPEKMGFITEQDAITADPDTMDWLLYQAVYKDVMTQADADAFQAWFEQRPSVEEAPELLQHQPAYLDRPGDPGVAIELLRETQAR